MPLHTFLMTVLAPDIQHEFIVYCEQKVQVSSGGVAVGFSSELYAGSILFAILTYRICSAMGELN